MYKKHLKLTNINVDITSVLKGVQFLNDVFLLISISTLYTHTNVALNVPNVT